MPRTGPSLGSESPELECQACGPCGAGKQPSLVSVSWFGFSEPQFSYLESGSDGASCEYGDSVCQPGTEQGSVSGGSFLLVLGHKQPALAILRGDPFVDREPPGESDNN